MKRIVAENVEGLSTNVATQGIFKTAGALTGSALILGNPLVAELAVPRQNQISATPERFLTVKASKEGAAFSGPY
jgi:hypothetical protein